MTPTLSVVIPVYGVERWLDACLESVCVPALADAEVICVDDCSPDACPAMLDAWAMRDPRIRVLHLPENHGQGYARNRGLELATGDYVYFLDSDDMVDADVLVELVGIARRDDLDGLFFDSRVVFDSDKLAQENAFYEECHTGSYPDAVTDGLSLFRSFMRQHDWTCYVQRQLWRREYLVGNGLWFPDASSHEDEAFAFEAIALAPRVRYVPSRAFLRRYREGSVMTTPPSARGFYSYFVGLCHMVRFARDHGIDVPELDVLLARIRRSVVHHRKVLLARGVDLEGLFPTDEGLMLYRLLDEEIRMEATPIELSDGLLARALSTPHLYVYGTGVVARDVFRLLADRGAIVEGFLVTSAKDNPPAFMGRPVTELSCARRPDDGGELVIVAVTDRFRSEIDAGLDAAGWNHAGFKD